MTRGRAAGYVCAGSAGKKAERAELAIPAQKFRSCEKRAGETFGAAHVVDVPPGSKSQTVIYWGHDKLLTHGIGREFSRAQWLEIGRQLVRCGYLERESEYRTLRRTGLDMETLRARTPIFGMMPKPSEQPSEPAHTLAPAAHDAELFERLRILREEPADAAGVPPYVVFSDWTPVEMATCCPQSDASFVRMNGVGQVKAQRSGGTFVGMIRSYSRERGLAERMPQETRPRSVSMTAMVAHRTRAQQIAEASQSGLSIAEVAAVHGIKMSAVIRHLTEYVKIKWAFARSRALAGGFEVEPGRAGGCILGVRGAGDQAIEAQLRADGRGRCLRGAPPAPAVSGCQG